MMKKRRKRKVERKKFKVKETSLTGIFPVIFFVALLALFSETVRTLPVGALSEIFFDLPYDKKADLKVKVLAIKMCFDLES